MSLRKTLSLLLITLLTLAACDNPQPAPTATSEGGPTAVSPTPINLSTPDGAAQAYLSAWQARDYAAMYTLLSPSVQQTVTPDAFAALYTDAMTAMTAQSFTLDVDMTRLASTATTARLPFAATYETVTLGPVTRDLALSLNLEGTNWTVLWDPSLILPEMAGGKVLSLAVDAPERANIYDRNGDWLVQSNSPTATISVIPSLVGDEEEEADLLDSLSRALRMPQSLIKNNYSGYGPAYDQPVAVGDIDQEVLDNIWPNLRRYEAVSIAEGKFGRRNYYNLAPHILGYTSYIPAEQLEAYKARGYSEGAIVGITGLEASQEDILAGKRGGTLSACMPDGTLCSQIASRASEPALNVYTTIDRELQTITQDALEDAYRAGSLTWAPDAGGAAAIVIDVHTGEILAIASYPYFDANAFNPNNGNPLSTGNYTDTLFADPRHPLFNRATSGAQPPGSIFKIVTLAATLDSGVYTPDDHYVCNGVWDEYSGGTRLDWKEGGHGDLSLIQALTASCNPWFYRMGLAMGQQDFNILPNMAKAFGLGAPTGIEIDEEPGVVPDPAWLSQEMGETWSLDDSINMAVGQGNLLVTPIQMVNVTSAIANGGTLYRPHLIKAIGPSFDAPTNIVEPQVSGTIPISAEQINDIREGMHGVTSTIGLGTAEDRVGGMQIPTAGKTGTAQVSSGAQPIAWFTGYLPYDNPELAVIVMVENGGQGSTIASPIFRRIMEEWYGLRVFHWPDDWLDPELYQAVKDIGE